MRCTPAATAGSTAATTVLATDPVSSSRSITHSSARPGTAMFAIVRSVSAGSSELSSFAVAATRISSPPTLLAQAVEGSVHDHRGEQERGHDPRAAIAANVIESCGS